MPSATEMMNAWAKEAVLEAFKAFSVRLDGKEESIDLLERVLSALSQAVSTGRVSKDDIWLWSTRYGAYLGMLITLYVGSKWEIKPHPKVGFGYAIPLGGVIFFPIVKVYDRLLKGESENVVEYYARLKELAEPETE